MLFSFFLAFCIRLNFNFYALDLNFILFSFYSLAAITALVFLFFRSYSGIVRYTGVQDAFRLIKSVSVIVFSFYLFSSISKLNDVSTHIDFPFVILFSTFSFSSLFFYRLFVKYFFSVFQNFNTPNSRILNKNVVLYGAGDVGVATKRYLEQHSKEIIKIVAFVDDNPLKIKKELDGIPIIGFAELSQLVMHHTINELIISSFSMSVSRLNQVVEFCFSENIKVLKLPSMSRWTDLSSASFRPQAIKIEDLLDRDSIDIRNSKIGSQISGKRILVTGAAGSIGSEIVRQIISYDPELIILCDQAETPLYELELALNDSGFHVNLKPFLADITNEQKMDDLFSQYRPHIVYHAAAYKHVPMMELNPGEAIKNNVLGTKCIADLAVTYAVEHFVMVSTDKAVNPTNVMGASKRIAEIYVQALSTQLDCTTKFITTRFGNVLGSNGSVIHRFKDQISKGGPLTVTHPEITRYFMTIPEACQLVLEAGNMGNGGEIYVFDMGKPIKIADLATKMIKLYGYTPGVEIDISYTGLRQGEKLYEELLSDEENVLKTHHEKIMIAKVRNIDLSEIVIYLSRFNDLINDSSNNNLIVALMKKIVPEFISNNSVFQELDLAKIS